MQVIEDEVQLSPRHFPRKYGEIFENYGMKQLECMVCTGIEGLGNQYYLRVFEKVD